jgi:poly(A) polymerase
MNLEEAPFNRIRDILLTNREEFGEIYLIGGYVRDSLLQKLNKDLDFCVTINALSAARRIADNFKGDYYVLDYLRGTARALIKIENKQIIVDVATINGENINEDLLKRDFTINAMAVDLTDIYTIIDPLNGKSDLEKRRLNPCSKESFTNDPVRTLRAVRFIQSLSLDYDIKLKQTIIDGAMNLKKVSGERIRDELCHIFNLPDIKKSLQLLVEFDIFRQLFPELLRLNNISSQHPHVHGAFTHTFRVVELTQIFMEIIKNSTQIPENELINDVQLLVGKYKNNFEKFLKNFTDRKISLDSLMIMAALYHDVGKVFTTPIRKGEEILYPEHAEKSVNIVQERMKELAFSNEEILFVNSVIRFHMAVVLKTIGEEKEPSRNVYRYFRETADSGVMIGLLHLADLLATYEKEIKPERWNLALKSVDIIFDGWFNHFSDLVSPPKLLNGNDLMEKFGLQPGRELGKILEQIREEQAAGIILDRNAAFSLAEKIINGM